jgi:hypothetical protein
MCADDVWFRYFQVIQYFSICPQNTKREINSFQNSAEMQKENWTFYLCFV